MRSGIVENFIAGALLWKVRAGSPFWCLVMSICLERLDTALRSDHGRSHKNREKSGHGRPFWCSEVKPQKHGGVSARSDHG
jgi:hypothetical protein